MQARFRRTTTAAVVGGAAGPWSRALVRALRERAGGARAGRRAARRATWRASRAPSRWPRRRRSWTRRAARELLGAGRAGASAGLEQMRARRGRRPARGPAAAARRGRRPRPRASRRSPDASAGARRDGAASRRSRDAARRSWASRSRGSTRRSCGWWTAQDVAEEVQRLRSHVAQARGRCWPRTRPAGKRLDFLAQELAREANTIGSKVGLGGAGAGGGRRSRPRSSGCASRCRTLSRRAAQPDRGLRPLRRRQVDRAARVLAECPTCASRSRTPRAPPRPGEREGVDYHFVDDDAVRGDGRPATRFLEWAEVHGHRYGTARARVRPRASATASTCCSTSTCRARRRCGAKLRGRGDRLHPAARRYAALERAAARARREDDEASLQRRLAAAGRGDALLPRLRLRLVNDDLDRSVEDAEGHHPGRPPAHQPRGRRRRGPILGTFPQRR